MNDKQVKVVVGALVHDIGKLLYRYNNGKNHCVSGYDFLKEQGITEKEILDQVLFHHEEALTDAELSEDSLAYITYWADNVAAGADGRQADVNQEAHSYDKYVPLDSVFNLLNNNNQHYSYSMQQLCDGSDINYPSDKPGKYSEEIYEKIVDQMKDGLSRMELSTNYVNSLLGIMEANLSFISSSTDRSQLSDISLYDHMKITAAVGGCIYQYLQEKGRNDFKEELFHKYESVCEEKCFLMVSMDISGIQSFLYTLHSEGALKTLRAKSFYMEIMLEHIIDELLDLMDFSRINLIYSGGGHAYILLPNTEKAHCILEQFENNLNDWFIEYFDTHLYVALGSAGCSANQLMDKPAGSYSEIFREVSQVLSQKKMNRYSAEQIMQLNHKKDQDYYRECKVCGRMDRLTVENLCEFCEGFRNISDGVLNKQFITILRAKNDNEKGIMLPFGRYMVMETESDVLKRMKENDEIVRSYSKNKMLAGYNISTKLWVGDYHQGNTFEELAESSVGIKRLGVLRADVDNLGQAFVHGFDRDDSGKSVVSLSRTATFSRKLNMFFKLHINHILENGIFSLNPHSKVKKKRNAVIVYSGGDDLFIIGAWNDVIEGAVDIQTAFQQYCQGTLTLSAGIGLFPAKYPVKAMARLAGDLEDASKLMEGKNAITLFDADGQLQTYKWGEFTEDVAGEKLALLQAYFSKVPEKGSALICKMLGFIRGIEDKINLARLAYLLGRLEPERKADAEIKRLFAHFSKSVYYWISSENCGENSRRLITAIYLYVYLNRDSEEERDEKNNEAELRK